MRVLTVCLGNICRSPTAAAAIRSAAADRSVPLGVDSAGTSTYHLGEPPDPRMVAAAGDAGLTLTGSGRQVTVDDLGTFDLVLAMDRSNEDALRAMAPDPATRRRIRRFREFDPAVDGAPDVPDPYFGGADGFRDVVEICRRTAAGLVDAVAAGRLP